MASKSADIRPGITLACTVCKERNYITTKNRRNTPDRLELKKFCPKCGKPTRVSHKVNVAVDANGKKNRTMVRVCKKCGADID